MSIDPVILQLRADVAGYNAKVDQARKLTDERLGAIERRGASMSAGITKGFSLAGRAALTFAAGFVTLDLAGKILAVADQAKNLDAQLRLATTGFGTFGQATEDVRRVAADTRSGLVETAALYGNLARTGRELGLTQADVARATETVAKTYKISGTGAIEAAQSTRQLIQALQSGVLRGDEFNSIMEASPRLARLLADSLDVPVGSLRAMAEAGTLTADKLARAFTDTRFTDGIDAEFRQLPVTFGEAMTSVYNAAIVTFGAFDRGGQFSTAIANFVSDGSSGFADLESAAESFGRTLSSELAGVIAVAETVIDAIRRINDGLGGLPADGLSKLNEGAKFLNPLNIIGYGIRQTPAYKNAAADRERSLQRDAGEQFVNDALRGRDVMGNLPTVRRSTPAATGPKKRTARGPSAESLAAKAERDRISAIRNEAEQAQDKARLEDDIIAARAALATAAKDVYAFELQMIDREKAARLADISTREKIGDLGKAQADEQRQLVAELAQAKSLRAIQNKRDADFQLRENAARDDLDTLSAVAGATTNRKERVEVEKRILALQHQIESARLEEAIAAGKIADVATARANLGTRQAADNAVLARGGAGPLDQYRERLRQSGENIDDEVQSYVVEELDHVRDGIRGALEKAIGTDDPLISGLLNLLIEQVILKPLADALAGASGGGGGIGGFVASIGAAIFGRASGGRVNAGQMVRVNEGASPGRVEGFIPQGAGHVVPLGRMNALRSGGGQRIYNISIDASNSVNPAGFEQRILAQANAQAQAMDGQTARAVLNAVPSRMNQMQRDGY